MDIQPGDLVQLKSGGPKMTVEKIGQVSGQTVAFCTWFEGTNVKRDHFSVGALQKF